MEIPRYNKVLLYVFFIAILCAVVFLRNKYSEARAAENTIISMKIEGVIVYSKDISRGTQYFEILNRKDSIVKCTLHVSSFFKENNIGLNDSISKEGNSEIMLFYKYSSSGYRRCCECDISF